MAIVDDYPLANILKLKFLVNMLHCHFDSKQQTVEAFLLKSAIDHKSAKNQPKYLELKQLAGY